MLGRTSTVASHQTVISSAPGHFRQPCLRYRAGVSAKNKT